MAKEWRIIFCRPKNGVFSRFRGESTIFGLLFQPSLVIILKLNFHLCCVFSCRVFYSLSICWCLYFPSFSGLRVKIPIIKNCVQALKRGKNTLWGRQKCFSSIPFWFFLEIHSLGGWFLYFFFVSVSLQFHDLHEFCHYFFRKCNSFSIALMLNIN